MGKNSDRIGPNTRLCRTREELLTADADGETVMMSVDKGFYYGLDEVATEIWNMLAEPRTVVEIEGALLELFDVTPEVCREDLQGFLEELVQEGLAHIIPDGEC